MHTELNEILEKVSMLYRRYGIKSITMDDAAKELGISKKTLYQYVSDKTDLVRKVVEQVRQCNFQHFKKETGVQRNAIEELVEVSQHVHAVMRNHSPSYEFDLKKYYPDIYKDLMSARRKLMYEAMLANIRKGKKEGLYRKELDEVIISKLHLLRIENLQESGLFKEDEILSVKLFREVFLYHIHGMATREGIRVLEKNMDRINMPETMSL